jgi:hypothetical protein
MVDDQYPSDFITHMPDRRYFDRSGPWSSALDFDVVHREEDNRSE